MDKEKLIDDFARGIEEKRYTTVMAVGRKFVLFRVSGHSFRADLLSREYAPVQFVLIRKGQWWLGNDTEKRVWQGRIPRSVVVAAFQQAEDTGKIERGVNGAKR